MLKKILISGGSGLVGKRLTELLVKEGFEVSHLSRSARKAKAGGVKVYQWDIEKDDVEIGAIENADAIVHLAGAGVADKPWSEKRKKEILESRTSSTALLYRKLKHHSIQAFVSASAIGFYGFGGEHEWFDENSSQGEGFLADVTKAWEDEIDQIGGLDIRVVKLRIGIVLSEKGGALKEIMKPVKLGVGAALGSGRQGMSWVHIDDLCHMFMEALKKESYAGVYNAVAPNPVSNREFSKLTAKVLQKPFFMPAVPAFILKLALGDRAGLVLQGSKVKCDKIVAAGYRHKYTKVEEALKNLLKP